MGCGCGSNTPKTTVKVTPKTGGDSKTGDSRPKTTK